jgi:soluble lytic murein transglycosylase
MRRTIGGLAVLGLLAVAALMVREPTAIDQASVSPPASTEPGVLDAMATGSLVDRPAVAAAVDPGSLRIGLEALERADIGDALAARDQLPPGSIERQALTWAIASSGASDVSSADIAAAQKELGNWAAAAALKVQLERALYREDVSPERLEALLGDAEAATPEGTILRARALVATGDSAAARELLSPWWHRARLDARHDMTVISEFGDLLDQTDHRLRMEQMLYIDRIAAADRVAGLAGAPDLARAFAAVTRNESGAGTLLDAVPENQRSAAYVFAQSRHLRRTGKYREAAEIMLEAPTDPALLVDPDAWWIERRVLSRELLDIGDPATAYRLAAAHAAESPEHAADAEFHAGWYAFRGLGDAGAGARHFTRIADIAEGPISRARAYYWLGRTADAGAEGESRDYYAQAARNGTNFYGQLAAARLGLTTIESELPSVSDAERSRFDARGPVQAIRLLETAGQPDRADSLYRALAEELESAAEIALLAGMAETRGDHYLALRIAKQASWRGLEVGGLAHPTGVIPPDAAISGSGTALAYAIARQESEFNVAARSGAGALGLLQLLPGTARDMARKTGLDYVPARLTADAGYNATLGASYLDDQLSRFGGSYILTFIGYNAGPRRADEWIARYGDPRGKPIETVVDWIERIPYTETRGYVQRVMENYQVYKMRLSGQMDIEGDLVNGRRPTE